MITKLLEGIGSKLADRWIVAVFSPRVPVPAAGLAAWVWAHGGTAGWQELDDWTAARTGAELAVIVSLLLLGVVALAAGAQTLTLPVIRVLEGYVPARSGLLLQPLLARQRRQFHRLEIEYDRTAERLDDEPGVRFTLSRIEDAPAASWPTRVSDAHAIRERSRASETRPYHKYGLDPVRCWPQLWLVLPAATRDELSAARARSTMRRSPCCSA